MLNLITFNRWWDANQVDEIYLKPYKRGLFYSVIDYLDDRQILAVYGIRRTGKTTLLYQLIDSLIKKGIPAKNILYFSFDDNSSTLEELFKNYSELVISEPLFKQNKIYVFLDEIQKLDNWQNQIKIFYDLYPNMKFVISGSAGILLQKGAKESLAGRIFEFVMPLLPFREFLELKNEKIPPAKYLDFSDFNFLKQIYLSGERISPHLLDYAKKGGFLEIINETDDRKIKEYGRTIVERVIFGDLTAFFKVKHPNVFKSILELIMSNPGLLLDYASLSKLIGHDQRMMADYIFYLKYAMLIKVFYNFSRNKFASERKLKKAYMGSTNFIFGSYPERFQSPDFLGKIIENLVAINIKDEFFWRLRNSEIDFISKDAMPIEVKYKNQISNKEIAPILHFCEKFKVKEAVILTKDMLKQELMQQIKVNFIPVWMFLLMN